jgi:hypothetical protein
MRLDPVRLQVGLGVERQTALLARIAYPVSRDDLDLGRLLRLLDLNRDLLLLRLVLIALRLMDAFVMVEKGEMGEHQPADLAFESDVGYGVLGQRHLIDQGVVVAEGLGYVALVVWQLRHVHGGVVGLCGVWCNLVDHVHVGVAEGWKGVFLGAILIFVFVVLLGLLVLDLRLLRRYGIWIEHHRMAFWSINPRSWWQNTLLSHGGVSTETPIFNRPKIKLFQCETSLFRPNFDDAHSFYSNTTKFVGFSTENMLFSRKTL